MELPEYIIATEFFDPGIGYWIVRTESPFMIGRVVLVHSYNQELIDTMNFQVVNGKRTVKCKGHYIYVTEEKHVLNAEVSDEVANTILSEMAEHLSEQLLDRKPSRFRVYNEDPKPLPTKETRHFYAEKKRAYQLRKAKELIAKSRQYERVDPDDNF